MTQLGRTRGLIDYATLDDCQHERSGGDRRSILKTIMRPRTMVYFAVWAGIGLALLFLLGARQRIDISVAKDRNPPFMLLSSGEVRNAYTLKLRNMEARPRQAEVVIEGLPGASMWTDGMPREKAARRLEFALPADRVEPVRLYVVAPAGTAPQSLSFALTALDKEGGGDRANTRFDAAEDE